MSQTTQTTKLERLAAIVLVSYQPQLASRMEGAWSAATNQQRRRALDTARAILEALRKPTEEMLLAAVDDFTGPTIMDARRIWPVMIDHILNEGQE